MTIQNYIADLEHKQDLYNRNWRNVLHSIYLTAFERFERTLADQAALDKRKGEIMMLFASLAIGGGMTALFGTAVMRTAVANGALNVVCNNNMNRAFNAMHLVSSSPAAGFIIAGAWDGVGKQMSTAVQTQMTGLVSTNPVRRGISQPAQFQVDLDNYVLDCKNAANAFAIFVRDHPELSDAQRTSIADILRRAPFFRDAPQQPVVAGAAQTRAAQEVELLMYATIIMDSDRLMRNEFEWHGNSGSHRPVEVGRVNQATTSPSYPSATSPNYPGGTAPSSAYVDYQRPGGGNYLGLEMSEIMERVNGLHNSLYGSPFEQGEYGRDEIARAERLSARIQRQYLGHSGVAPTGH